jgi:hypothetical protein
MDIEEIIRKAVKDAIRFHNLDVKDKENKPDKALNEPFKPEPRFRDSGYRKRGLG